MFARVQINRLFICILPAALGLCLSAGCSEASAPSATPAAPSSLELLLEVAPSRTPEPTATPDALTEGLVAVLNETGLPNQTLLGLSTVDWLNLGISLLLVLLGYLLGVWLIRRLLPRLAQRTATTVDDRLLSTAGAQILGLILIVTTGFALRRLVFLPAGLKRLLADGLFLLGLFFIAAILWRLIGLAADVIRVRAIKDGYEKEANSLLKWLVWPARAIVLLIALSALLTHYAINVTGITIILGIIVLIISLAARDLLTDVIAGMIILFDQPFRIGDRIDLTSLDTMGDVVDIGMRSTRIITLDNRMVIVPNSQIGKNQVVNYTAPDLSYMLLSDILVAYENDVEQVRRVISAAVRSVDGVAQDRDVDVVLQDFSEYSMRFRISWWIASHMDQFVMRDRVNRAAIEALKGADVTLPYDKSKLTVSMDTSTKQGA